MKSMTVYLTPHSSFCGERPPRSDTLFGALCWGYKLLFGNDRLEDLLRQFLAKNPPFLISSMFYYVQGEDGKEHVFPKPFGLPFDPGRADLSFDELRALKTLKKIRFVNERQFSEILAGKEVDRHVFADIVQQFQGQKTPEPQGVSLHPFQTPHSAINRLTGAVEGSRFYYTGEFALAARPGMQAGLFCCVKSAPELLPDLKTVFAFLADKGIGGKASVGKGHFQRIEFGDEDTLPYQEPEEDCDHVLTLSLTFPDAHISSVLDRSWYEPEKRQGKMESMYTALGPRAHIWKDHLLMLKEGSVFPKNDQTCYGENPIARKDDGNLGFDVQHYGFAFPVKIKRGA